ncbi:hypothetical protein FVEG_14611 [Fusarium verticillioides 7600]|uniref:Uncharacterized protein n=1 Tax=Gibberella moniliformis (strain M3125 / FGSC 7600) TaxID=334819 RepID=W7LKJ3_GIBM7|nr:hypothetical protein FVEG_14611 [Fusarium verticillioides 7600]EWG36070.1 hypothetical protein FVEG_14611 [Fusarium verticillioides 7600]
MVASTIITVSGHALLNKFAIGLAGEAGTWVFKQILHSASGGSDTNKIRRDISGAVTEMKELKRTVDTLSRELPEALLQLRSDNLRESLTKIETMYDTITDLMETAVTLPEDMSDVERDKKLNSIQTRLEDRLRMFSDIPGILDRINDFLAEDGPRSFLRQAIQKTFDNSDEFISYYERAKPRYWVVVAKGISLLQMAYDAPNVDFSEGMLTIRRQKDKLDRQDQFFKVVVGENTVRLVECALSSPSSTHVTLLSDEGFAIGHKLPSNGDISSLSIWPGQLIPIHRKSNDPVGDKIASRWDMQLGCGDEAGLGHAVIFAHFSSERCMLHHMPFVSMVERNLKDRNYIAWLIKPVCPGSDRYTIRAPEYQPESPSPINELLTWTRRGWRPRFDCSGSHLAAKEFLQMERNVSIGDTGTSFQIKL